MNMQKAFKTFFTILVLLILTACISGQAQMGAIYNAMTTRASVYMPPIYQEVAPYTPSPSAKPGVRGVAYSSAAYFKHSETGEIIKTGVESGRTRKHYLANENIISTTYLDPGTYDLVSFAFDGRMTDYDQNKCGRIGFTVASKDDHIIFNGLRPLAITDGPFMTGRKAAYPAFTGVLHERAHLITEGKARHQKLESENQAAFKACVDAVHPQYPAFMKDDGAYGIK